MGLEPRVPPGHRLPPLAAVWIPEGVEEAGIRQRLLDEHNIEIARGLGVFKGRAWRIGLMGYSSRRENVSLLLPALKEAPAGLIRSARRALRFQPDGFSLGLLPSRDPIVSLLWGN